MSKKSISLIDKGEVWEFEDYGPPILFPNVEIRRMLKLAKAGKNDVVFDLGCGWAQNLIIANNEFSVKKCVGIERLEERVKEAKKKVRQWSLSNQITIIKGQYQDLFEGKIKDARLEDATVIIYLLESDRELIKQLVKSKKLRKGCRFLYYYNALFPEIKPDAINYPFYVSIFPFKRPKSTMDWLSSIIQKEKSSFEQDKPPREEELWVELSRDYDVLRGDKKDIKGYKRRLKQILKEKIAN